MRQNFTDGQEIVNADLNSIQSRMERQFYDRILFEMLGKTENGFFGSGFTIQRVNTTEIRVNAGLGLQRDNSVTMNEPQVRPIYLPTNKSVGITPAHATLNRIDRVVVRSTRANLVTESRRVKAALTDAITNQQVVTVTDWSNDMRVITGEPNANPAAPAIPAGFISIATILITANVGINAQGDITDGRTIMPTANPSGGTGSHYYDKIVSNSLTPGVTHTNLTDALAAANDYDRILILTNLVSGDQPFRVNNEGVELDFKGGVRFTRGVGGQGVGLLLHGNKCVVRNARFVNFNQSLDQCINVAGQNCALLRCEYFNCRLPVFTDPNVDDVYIDFQL